MNTNPIYTVSLAETPDDLRAAQRLRYNVFVNELGGDGPMVDHDMQTEADPYDDHANHLLLRDTSRPVMEQVVGVYRLMNRAQAAAAGGFVSAREYDLTPILSSGRPVLELGRSCLHPDHRGGTALFHLWQGLAAHVARTGTEILFGVASFHGQNPDALALPLSFLYHNYRAAAGLCPTALPPGACDMNRIPADQISRTAALASLPPLIKAYLRIGGRVGAGAWIDRDFNTIDVCMTVDVVQIPARERALYGAGGVK